MGAGESIPRDLTHERLFELTKDTRHVMSMLLQYMLKEVTVRDFLALSNPNECKKYVLFMANTLHKYFYELQIEPVKDKRGVIAFRSIKDLASSSTDDNDKQSLCLVLAYYYTRIFQIYGSLALTLIDDVTFMRDSGILSTFEGDKQRLLAPGYRHALYGGEIPDAMLGNFIFLKSFLYDTKDAQNGYLTRFTGKDDVRGKVFFKVKDSTDPSQMVDPTLISESTKQKGVFTFGYEGAKRYSYLEVEAERVQDYVLTETQVRRPRFGIKVSIGKLLYYIKGDSTPHELSIPDSYQSKILPIFYESSTSNLKSQYYIERSDNPLSQTLNNLLYKLMYFIKTLIEKNTVLKKYEPTGTIIDPITGLTTSQKTNTTTSSIISPLSMSEEGTIEELRLGKIINNLTQTKPLGHCIARALQLLRTVPFKDELATSYICKAKFFEATTKSSSDVKITRSGLPEPGSKLDSSPGLFSLSQLFYDTISIGTPKLVINEKPGPSGKSSLQQYIEFMRKMAILFGDNKDSQQPDQPRSSDSLRQSGLHGITNRRDQKLCQGITGDITIPATTAKQVYGVVQSLFQEQLRHATACSKIFRMLFDLQRDPKSGNIRISLSENVIKKGVSEINRVNYIAREQLIQYYSNCETRYVNGMKLVIDAKNKANQARLAASAPSAPILASRVPLVPTPTKSILKPTTTAIPSTAVENSSKSRVRFKPTIATSNPLMPPVSKGGHSTSSQTNSRL